MRFRSWLLTGTSLGMLALAPISVHAQDVELNAAYQNFVAAQQSGDAAAIEQAQASLTEMCIVAGYPNLDACIADLSGGGAAPAEEPAPPAEEPAAEEPAAEQPAEAAPPEAPAEQPVPEEAMPADEAPAPETMEAPAPAEEPAIVEPAPTEEAAPPAEAPVEEAPVPEQVAPVEEPENAESDMAPEPAPAPEAGDPLGLEEQPAEQAPEAETPAEQPAETQGGESVTEEGTEIDVGPALQVQIDNYNSAIADMMAGGDEAGARAQIDAARAEVEALCAEAGFPSTDACLAEYGLELPTVPALDSEAPAEEPAVEPEAAPAEGEVPAEGEPAAEEGDLQLPSEPEADGDVPAEATDEQPADAEASMEVEGEASGEQPVEIVDDADLPEGVTQEDVAPVLDSAKDAQAAPVQLEGEGEAAMEVEGEPAAEGEQAPAEAPTAEQAQPTEEAQPAEPQQTQQPAEPVAAPTSDIESQARLEIQASEIMSVREEQGERVEASAIEPLTVPQNVTIVNQTNVTNNTTNNVENNVQNNTVDNSTGDLFTSVIVSVGSQLYLNNRGEDTQRYRDIEGEEEVYYERLGNGRIRETLTRADGSQIVTTRNSNGDILRRSRITPDGQEYVLAYFDDRYYDDLLEWRDPADELPPLQLTIPVSDYVLDAEEADEQQIEVFFTQPPVEQVTRLYSVDEVKRSSRVRDIVRRLEVGDLTFDTGSANIGREQVSTLSSVANAMLDVLEQNPAETFLIEGHTDAVGGDVANLELSDSRAATVARVLTDFYGVPPENLVTQGYGERYLKIRTEVDERANRRVTIRRITPLITPYATTASAQ